MDVHFLSLGGYVFPRAAFGLPLTLNCVSEQATLEFDVFGKSKRARCTTQLMAVTQASAVRYGSLCNVVSMI